MNELITQTIALLGGKENITAIDHCITRVRLKVRDDSKVDFDALKKHYDSAVKGMTEHSVQLVVNQYKHEYSAADIASLLINE
ncbi:PTS glucose/sucrose transporter subunit IIB [Motilimonas sp. KMU-193]|uniref:PTS glucose/sucrose transporter subunit IIB n=1 Tax=Motilimonas sp. KMU-193 TaxID=3388668 RepID=UPI00396B3281